MSDFLYHSRQQQPGHLAGLLKEIHPDGVSPESIEYHGNWGSLAVTEGHYRGFAPIETNRHLFVVIGGPVLMFRDNRFLMGNDPIAGSTALFERFKDGRLVWDEDLSGPFAVLILDKREQSVLVVTDLMLFLPVYEYAAGDEIVLGTHVDAVAGAAQSGEIDTVSLADFVLHSVITWPYTTYKHIRQCKPAAVHGYTCTAGGAKPAGTSAYWEPAEIPRFRSISDAAKQLHEAVSGYINRVTEGMTHVGLLASGGEDSRLIAALLPPHLKRDAFIFLDNMNREGRLTRRVTDAFGMELQVGLRKTTHYLDILPQSTRLIGSDQQCIHAHTLGFYREFELDRLDAVFGGFLANSLLKGDNRYKSRLQRKLPFLSQKALPGEDHSKPCQSNLFGSSILGRVDERRRDHLDRVRRHRKKSTHEWFQIWPRTMGFANANIAVNRRLFRSYEPFTCNEVVKISAAIPQQWKLNRRLYHKAFHECFKPAQFVPHSKGHLPAWPWWANVPLSFLYWAKKKFRNRLGVRKVYDGPWIDWIALLQTPEWQHQLEAACSEPFLEKWFGPAGNPDKSGDRCHDLRLTSMFNLIQTRYFLQETASQSTNEETQHSAGL